MGFSTPSTGKACGASPLTLACARHGRTLHRAASDVRTLLSLLCFRRGVWGHSSRCFAFGGVSPLLSSGSTVQSASTPHAIVFSEAGKTILDPCKRIVHSPPELNQWCQFRHAINGARVAPSTGISLRSLPFIKRKIRKRPDASSDYWIGSPAGIPGGRAASIF